LIARFFAKVKKGAPGECWEWLGGKSSGYGYIDQKGAHVVSFELHKGPVHPGMEVLHHCDNRPCTNPEHLYAGTQMQNMHDKINRGRDTRGEDVCTAKLSTEQVEEIRQRYEAGETQVSLAGAFGVGQPHISTIVRRKAWRKTG
jgi:hypothetical protein